MPELECSTDDAPAEALDEMDNDSEDDLEEANRPISGSSSMKQIDVAVALLQWFGKFPGVSKEAVGELLQLMQKLMSVAFNEEVSFPTTFKKARSLIKPYLTEYNAYEICRNECTLFTGEQSSSRDCPTCGEERSAATRYLVTLSIPRLN